MKKTPLLLAFGQHIHPLYRTKGDTHFFKEAVIPFVEEHIKDGGKAVLVSEVIYHHSNLLSTKSGIEKVAFLLALEKDKETRSLTQLHLEEFEAGLNAELSKSVAVGLPHERFAGWGFEEEILGINKARQHAVGVVIEPQSVQATTMFLEIEMILETLNPSVSHVQIVGTLMDYLKKMAELSIMRDRAVVSLADRFSAENPEQAIAIPRGLAHREMWRFFDNEKYTISYEEGDKSSDIYSILPRFYREAPTHEELARFVQQRLACIDNKCCG